MFKLIRLYLFIVAIILALTSFCQSTGYNPSHVYSVSELQSDFKFLQTILEDTHPNLYLYTPKKEFNLFFDSLYKCIVKPLSDLEFYNLVALINSKVKDGHTMLLPGEQAGIYFTENDKFFPFYVAISDNRLYVSMNCSADTSIKDGVEILSINGSDAKDILQYLLARQIRDGNNQTYPVWILMNYFKEYFSFSFGHPEAFSITYKTDKANNLTKTINALSKDSIRFYRQVKYPERSLMASEKQGIAFQIDKQLSVATLSIKSFDYDILKSVYKQNFDSTIQEIFSRLYQVNVQNLILDIRDNQGGDFEPVRLLLSYLLRKSIKYLPHSNESKTIIPSQNGFKGNLYVLINGGSFSSTAILSSYLKSTKRGVFIGEETGGNESIISGNPMDTTLPNTKIVFEISTTKYLIWNHYNSGHGVMPDYHTSFSIDNIIKDKDIAKELALQMILKQK